MQGGETNRSHGGALQAAARARLALPSAGPSRRLGLSWVEGFRGAVTDAAENRRVFNLLPFAMIGGMICYVQMPVEPLGWALGLMAAFGLAILYVARNSTTLLAMLVLSAFWAGFCLLPLHGAFAGTTMLARTAYGAYEMRVDEVISANADAQRLVVSSLVPTEGDRVLPIVRARLVVPAEPPIAVGDTIRAKLRLAPVPGAVLPGTFDGQFHAYYAGIGAYGTVTSGFSLVVQGDTMDPLRFVENLRSAIGRRIDAVLAGSSAAIGKAMVVGDQSAITDETRELMAKSGLAHIYSISGLHLSIVAGGVFWLVRLALAAMPMASMRWPVKKVAAIVGIIAAVGYMMLAGGVNNVPALRSTIMLGLIFGAVLAGRRALTMRNVAIAAIAIILIDPASVFRASFQLSFAAVVALIGVYEMPRGKRERVDRNWLQRTWNVTWGTAITSFIAGTATLLFSAYHFQQTAPLGVVGNVLVLPVVSILIMPFGVLSVLAMPLGVEAPFLSVMGWGIDRMADGAELVAGWSEGLTGNPLLTGTALVTGLAALGWFSFFRGWWRVAGPLIAVPIVLLFCFDQRPDILIADSTQAVAIRGADGLGLVTGRTGSFVVDVWSDHYQEVVAASLPEVSCDSLGCIATTADYSVAVVRNAAAFAEDCGRHDLLIARIRAPVICGGQVIDSDDLTVGGVHWLAWNTATARFDIRTAVPNVTRPWRVWLP